MSEASVNSGRDQVVPVIDREAVSIVCTQAARLAGRHGFNSADRDDIRQELFLDCFVRLRRFNPEKSSRRTFLYQLVRHRAATLRESRLAPCRDYRLTSYTLDGSRWVNGEAISLGDSVSADYYDCGFGRSARTCWERSELRIDVEAVTAKLPRELITVVNLLRWVGVGEAAQQLGLSRATLYRRITDIRERFERAGLNLYLGGPNSSSLKRQHSCSEPSPAPSVLQRRTAH